MTAPWPQRRASLQWGGLSLLLFLSACASQRPKPASLEAFWSGRLSLQVQSTPPQNWSVNFELEGAAQQGQMSLLTPIGTSLARLSWSADGAMLEQGQVKTQSDSLQSLLQKLIGTDLPMTALFEWLAGQAAPAPDWQVDLSEHPQGRLTARRISPQPEAVLRILLDR